MISDVKLFVADIDNTLRGKNIRIPGPMTISAIEELRKRGILIGIASGRPLWQGVKDHYKEWKLGTQFDFLIGMNGGELWTKESNHKEVFNLLSTETLKEIVTTMKDLPDTNPFVYRDGYELSRYLDDDMIASGKRHGSRIETCHDDSDLWQEPTGKILYRCKTPENGERVETFGQHAFGNRISCFRTVPSLVELQDPRNNKGVALQHFCKKAGIDMKNVIAFGDAENDIEMLKAAGWSVCLKNGMDDVKAVSDDITEYSCDEDGVGRYLWKNILNQ